MYHVYISDSETVKLMLATPILEFETAKQSGAVPVERTLKASANIQLVRIGLVNSVNCEHGPEWILLYVHQKHAQYLK
jgi:hypothetical protein